MVGSLPAGAGDTGSSPGLGGSRMPRSGWARGPQLLGLRVWSLCSATGGAAEVRGPRTAMESGPRLPQLEKALAQKRRPNTAKKNKNYQKTIITDFLANLPHPNATTLWGLCCVPFCPRLGPASASTGSSVSWPNHVTSEFWETLSTPALFLPPVPCSPSLTGWQQTDGIQQPLSR